MYIIKSSKYMLSSILQKNVFVIILKLKFFRNLTWN